MTRLTSLVVGYGNTLRRDDGVGPRVAEAIHALHLPGITTLSLHQLSPEHAQPVSQSNRVLFVDAALDGPREVSLRPIEPNPSLRLQGHAANPATLLALARDVFGHAPPAWLLTIRARNLEFGESLEPATHQDMLSAIEQITHWASLRDV